MNLGSLSRFIDENDRSIIIHAMAFYKVEAVGGIKIRHNKAVEHHLVWLLDPHTVRKALCSTLQNYQDINIQTVEQDEPVERINRLLKLIDSIC